MPNVPAGVDVQSSDTAALSQLALQFIGGARELGVGAHGAPARVVITGKSPHTTVGDSPLLRAATSVAGRDNRTRQRVLTKIPHTCLQTRYSFNDIDKH